MQNAIADRAKIDLANWRTRPHSSWAFHNAAELVPTATIRGARLLESPACELGDFGAIEVDDLDGQSRSLREFLVRNHSDAFVVMRGGKFIAEWCADHNDAAKPHLVFSVSKSITGLLAGVLAGNGTLSLEAVAGDYVPEAIGSAYGDVPVRDLLNMQVSLDFDEIYLDRSGAFDRYRRAMLWNPEHKDEETPDLKSFLCTLPKASHPHGTRHVYRSPNTDMAALVIERAAGERFAELLSRFLWQPMGAHTDAQITVDRAGNPRASGGISMTARDLARVGELVRQGGSGVIPADWVSGLWEGGDRAIWAAGDQADCLPIGSYRNYWYETGTGELAAMGIHGQWLWVDRKTETVIVRQSAESQPIDEAMDQVMIKLLRKVSSFGRDAG